MDQQTQSEQPQPIPQPVIPTPPSSGNNFLLIGLIAFVALILGSGATYLALNSQKSKIHVDPYPVVKSTPTPTLSSEVSTKEDDPTANWKTYANTVMGFSIKVPPNWYTHTESKSFDYYSIHFSFPVDNSSTQNWIAKQKAQITIAVHPNNGKLAHDHADELIKQPYSGFNNSIIPITIDKQQGFMLSSKDNYRLITVNYIDLNYIISLGTPEGLGTADYPSVNIDEVLPTFNQMLSTFRFD